MDGRFCMADVMNGVRTERKEDLLSEMDVVGKAIGKRVRGEMRGWL